MIIKETIPLETMACRPIHSNLKYRLVLGHCISLKGVMEQWF